MAREEWRTDAGPEVTAVLVAVVVCVSGLNALWMVLTFLRQRDATKTAALSDSVANELTAKLKAAEDRISKLEMRGAFR